jgi:hypothetical protein
MVIEYVKKSPLLRVTADAGTTTIDITTKRQITTVDQTLVIAFLRMPILLSRIRPPIPLSDIYLYALNSPGGTISRVLARDYPFLSYMTKSIKMALSNPASDEGCPADAVRSRD